MGSLRESFFLLLSFFFRHFYELFVILSVTERYTMVRIIKRITSEKSFNLIIIYYKQIHIKLLLAQLKILKYQILKLDGWYLII